MPLSVRWCNAMRLVQEHETVVDTHLALNVIYRDGCVERRVDVDLLALPLSGTRADTYRDVLEVIHGGELSELVRAVEAPDDVSCRHLEVALSIGAVLVHTILVVHVIHNKGGQTSLHFAENSQVVHNQVGAEAKPQRVVHLQGKPMELLVHCRLSGCLVHLGVLDCLDCLDSLGTIGLGGTAGLRGLHGAVVGFASRAR